MWRYVSDAGPVEHNSLVERYYPGDATEKSESNQRKPLNDAIEFLVETEQFTNNGDGYELTEVAREEPTPQTALLWGIRSRDGENRAYNDVLDVLTEDNRVFFDKGDPLVDLLSDRRSGVSWNTTRLNYWRRMMEAVGVVRDLGTDSDEDYTSMLTIDQNLLYSLLQSVTSPSEPTQFQGTLLALHDRYLPVFAGSNRNEVASYVERALKQAQRTNLIEIGQESDFGPSVKLNGAGVNKITLRVKRIS
ncbi:hypothetical protein [Haladaptatus sp. CMSO5]|uniref:hypothetical protein n=1 Tax=Haladaptatus sp. CMSO5 TaxID=3120514 RepID=UPI002FCDEEB3